MSVLTFVRNHFQGILSIAYIFIDRTQVYLGSDLRVTGAVYNQLSLVDLIDASLVDKDPS